MESKLHGEAGLGEPSALYKIASGLKPQEYTEIVGNIVLLLQAANSQWGQCAPQSYAHADVVNTRYEATKCQGAYKDDQPSR